MKLLIISLILISTIFAGPPPKPPKPASGSGSGSYPSGSPPPPKSGSGSYPSGSGQGSGSYPSGSPPPPAPGSGSGSYPSGSGSGSYPSGSPPPPKPGSGSYSGSGSYPSGSPPPPATGYGSGSYIAPSNDELCGCYNIDLICDPFLNSQGEMCYYYKVVKSSDTDYCKPIEYLSLGTGNLDECGLTSTDIQSSLADYAPKCYDVDPLYDGTCNNGEVGVPGIKIRVNGPAPPPNGQQPPPPPPKSGSGSYPSGQQPPPKSGSGSGSYPSGSPPPPPKSGSGSGSYPSGSGGQQPPPPPPPKESSEFMVFSICFDPMSVSGVQDNGQISIKTGSGRSTCDAIDILPNFCDANIFFDGTTTIGPDDATTSAPGATSTTTASASGTTSPSQANTDARTTSPSGATSTTTTSAPGTTSQSQANTDARTTSAPGSTSTATSSPETTSTPGAADPEDATIEPTTADGNGEANQDAPECTSTDALNIAFLLDESGSIDSSEWDIITGTVERIITNDVSPESYVSLFEFASLPGYKQFLDWTGPKKNKETKMVRALSRMNSQYNQAGQTETWDAVNRVLDNFADYKQDCDGINDKCYQRHDVLFLVTDAEPTDKAGAPRQTCPYMEDRMLQSDVDVVIILVDPNDIIDASKVSCLDARDNEADIIKIKSINDIIDYESQIRAKTCSGNYPLTSGERPIDDPWQYCDENGENCVEGLGPVPDRLGNAPGGKGDIQPGSVHQASGNDENMDNAQHEHDGYSDDSNNDIPWLPIIAGIVFIALMTIGVVIYLRYKSKLKRDQQIVAVTSPGDEEEISKDKQIYGNDEGNASILMV